MPTQPILQPVILCGGSGTRLWPLSRKSLPKQFVPLLDGKSLLQATLERCLAFSPTLHCVAAEEHRFLVAQTMQQSNAQGAVLLEPQGRNTTAAMCIAAMQLSDQDNGDLTLLFCPADHFIPDTANFEQAAWQGLEAAKRGEIVTFGISPSHPSSAYGYIAQGEPQKDGSYRVARFMEKPSLAKAQELLLEPNVFWNSGIFMAQANSFLQAIQQHAPDIFEACQAAMDKKTSESPVQDKRIHFVRPAPTEFLRTRSESVDYAVMEHHEKVSMVLYTGRWSDVGSWSAVAELTPADVENNRVVGNGHAIEADSTFIHAPERTVVALGTKNLAIVDTPDAVLVVDLSRAEEVKHAVALLEDKNLPQATMHRKVERPWGWYDSLDRGERFQVKRICVKPGASLSLQKHEYRAEHWIVVRGTAQVTRGSDTFTLKENESTYIPIGEVHRLHNPGSSDLEMIEVQSGSYLGEDDIVRLEDTYGRA
jgi:mannose-1-phosphate guanylyltransferase / mannose-6-phosphate isomerase